MSELANSSSSWDMELSPFANVIGTNHIPSIDELRSLKVLLVHPQHELSRLEMEVDRVQALLVSLQSKRQKILDYINAHKALASPVRQIPPETLAEIFTQCLPTDPSYGIRDLTQAPLILTTICRDWRRVAITTPRLWNSLHVHLPLQMSDDACILRIAGTKLWLSRSHSLPLSISFHNPNLSKDLSNTDQGYPESMRTALMISALMEFSDRFRDISLSLPSIDFVTFDKLSPTLFPSLVSLRVGNGDRGGFMRGNIHPVQSHTIPPPPRFAPLLSRMPFLRKLEVDPFDFEANKTYHLLPCNWRNLTDLVINDCLAPGEVLAILAETPGIQSISLLVSTGHSSNMNQTMIHLHDLTEMQLTISPGRNVEVNTFPTHLASYIDCIQCPALRLFTFTSDWSQLGFSGLPFANLPLQSLTTLKLNLPITSDALTECLSQTPDLINFELVARFSDSPFRDSHLSSLTFSPQNTAPLWPCLRSIRILDSTFAHFPVENEPMTFTSKALTIFLESRSRTLQSCDVFYPREPQPSFSTVELNSLKNLKRNGMKIRLHHQALEFLTRGFDLPDAGIRTSRNNPMPLSREAQAAQQPSLNGAPSDMVGTYGTVVII